MAVGILLSEISAKLWKIVRTLLILGLSFVLLYPLIYIMSIAFRPVDELMDPSIIWLPRSLTLDNIKQAFENMKYMSSLWNSIIIGGVSSAIQTLSCCFVAYGFARFKFREKNFFFALVIVTILVPPQVTLIPLYMMFKEFSIPFIGKLVEEYFEVLFHVNLLDNPTLFYLQALFNTGIRSGLYIFMLRQYFIGMPLELEEAAEIDGCNPLKTFIKVILPNAGSILLTVTLFSVVFYWNDYFNTEVFLNSRKTLSISLLFLRSELASISESANNIYESTAAMQAGCLLFILPMLLMYIFLQRYFTESIERSGLVG